MIDIHCHILPDIDDGPKTFEESVAMAKVAVNDGVAVIVATPHLNEKLYEPVEISRRVSYLNHLLRQADIQLRIVPGAEVSVMFRPDQIGEFTINNTDYVLVEFPHMRLPHNADEILHQFVVHGYKPIIAHPERNSSITRNPKMLMDLLGENRYVQITASSLTGDFGKEIQKCSQHLLRAGVVDVIASDAHSPRRRTPRISHGMEAAAALVGAESAKRMVFGAPMKIIAGLDL